MKDDESRVAPVLDLLLPILSRWREKTGGDGFCFLSTTAARGGNRHSDEPLITNAHTLLVHLSAALRELKMPKLTWYQCTRHTFASHWVLRGGSIERLAVVLGHSSTWVSERYAHLRPELFLDEELGRFGAGGQQVASTQKRVHRKTAAGGLRGASSIGGASAF